MSDVLLFVFLPLAVVAGFAVFYSFKNSDKGNWERPRNIGWIIVAALASVIIGVLALAAFIGFSY